MGTKASKGDNRDNKHYKQTANNDYGYLDFPRLHFYGKFRANPSTDNNDPDRYGRAIIEPFNKFQTQNLGISFESKHDNWNPYGDATWSFKDCLITAAYGQDGKLDAETYNNFEINPASDKISGRLVDLDADQQSISRIYGFAINICDKNNNNKILLSSNFEAASFHNMWLRTGNLTPYQGMLFPAFSSSWISVLTDCKFSDFDGDKYKTLNLLKKYAESNGNMLQIKFITDGFNNNFNDTTGKFTYGRVYGVIGIYSRNNPTRSIKFGRYLSANNPGSTPGLVGGFGGQYISIKYDQKTQNLYVDLGNAFMTDRCKSGYGEPVNLDVGDINIYCNDKLIKTITCKQYTDPDSFKITGGIYSFINVKEINKKEWFKNAIIVKFDSDKITALNKKYKSEWNRPPVSIPGSPMILLCDSSQEAPNGYYTISENLQLRLATSGEYMFGNNIDFTTYISQYGVPKTTKKDESITITSQCIIPDATDWSQDVTIKNVPINGNQINDGFFRVNITAPYTLKNDDQMLPRWNKQYFDSQIPPIKEKKFENALYVHPNGPKPTAPPPIVYDGNIVKIYLILKTEVSKDTTYVIKNIDDEKTTYSVSIKKDEQKSDLCSIPVAEPNVIYKYAAFLEDNQVSSTLLVETYQYYVDSLTYNICVKFGDNDGSKKQNMKNVSHHISKDDIKMDENDDDEKDEKDEKKDNDDSKSLNFFVGSVLVFNEMESKNLPPIIAWQPEISSDQIPSVWQMVVDNLPTKPCIHPIFRQYANLYPIMKDIVNLDNYQDVTRKLSALKRAFDAPFDSAHFMPITRDISGQKLMLIQSWLNNPIYCDVFIDPLEMKGGFYGPIRDKDRLKCYLQDAIELELSTLPLYLSAVYSMDPNNKSNQEIISLIQSITHQEMQHMALACNLLIAIGGKPRIAYRDVVERTSFPRRGLIKSKCVNVLPSVPLQIAPMNLDSTIKSFMTVEAPAKLGKISDIDKITIPIQAQFIVNSQQIGVVNTDEKVDDDEQPYYTIYSSKAFERLIASTDLIQNIKNDEKFKQKTLYFESDTIVENINMNVVDDDDDDDEKKFDDNLTHTIGGFYELIRKGFAYLSIVNGESNLFDINNISEATKKQIGPDHMKDVNYVYNLKTALGAIESIVSEGEGTSLTDIWASNTIGELSHFHKFFEIYMQHPIVTVKRRKATEKNENKFPYIYVFANDVKIPFDENGVINDQNAWDWLKLENKDKMKDSKNGKDDRVIRFNEDYGKLLICLQDIFGNGKSEKFGSAVGLMRQLQIDFNDCLRPPTVSGKAENDKTDKTLQPRIAPNWIPPEYIIIQ